MKYAAVDFELGNSNLISACSVGVAVFEDFRLVKRCGSLIRPPAEAGPFHWGNVRVHGIGRKDVRNAPPFSELWPRLREDLEDSVIVCHNADVDTAVLCACLDHFGFALPRCRYLCTVKVSQTVWPELENHRLNTVAEALRIPLNHHESGSDAYAAGEILLKALQATGCADADALSALLGIPLRALSMVRKHEQGKETRRRRGRRRYAAEKIHQTSSEKERLL